MKKLYGPFFKYRDNDHELNLAVQPDGSIVLDIDGKDPVIVIPREDRPKIAATLDPEVNVTNFHNHRPRA